MFDFIKLINTTGIDILSMSRAPVNSLNIQLLDSLKTSLLEAKNSHSKGIILTSSLPSVFSAGLDLVEFYNKDKNQLVNYWQTLQDTWLTLYTMDIPTAAAINVQTLYNITTCVLVRQNNKTVTLHRVPVLLEVVCSQYPRSIGFLFKANIPLD